MPPYYRLEGFKRKGIILDGALYNVVDTSIKWKQLGFIGWIHEGAPLPEVQALTYRRERLEELIATQVAHPFILKTFFAVNENIKDWHGARKGRLLYPVRIQRKPNEPHATLTFQWKLKLGFSGYHTIPFGKFLAYLNAGKVS